MYPLSDGSFSLGDLARHWSRGLDPRMPEHEVRDRLLAAVWRGELVATPSGATSDARPRLRDIIARVADHPGILFVRPGETPEPEVLELADGGALVDPRVRIRLDADDGGDRDSTYAQLAPIPLEGYSPDVAPILLAVEITRQHFRAYCEASGFKPPAFWFDRRTAASSAGAETRCRKWLSDLVRAGLRSGTKADICTDARKRFSGLSERAFHRIWHEIVPPDWKTPGRPRAPTSAGKRHNHRTPR